MTARISGVGLIAFLATALPASADPPVLSYVFPAGGQRGSTVKVRVGGLNLYDRCRWEIVGKGLSASESLGRITKIWREGPLLPLPDSQRQEDYPSDMGGEVRIAGDAPLGTNRVRLWTSEGAAGGVQFVVGDLPEVVEDETKPELPQLSLPITVNGRIFPREDVDDWTFPLKKGHTVTAVINAARIGSKLDSRLEAFGPDGTPLADNDDALGTDSRIRFTAPVDGLYRIRVSDSQRLGSQAHVYRLTLTTGPVVDRVYPAGGQRNTKVKVALTGANLARDTEEVTVPGPYGLDVSDLPEIVAQPDEIKTPCVINGRIEKPGQVDIWRFTAKKAEPLAIEVRKILSPLLPVLEVKNDGKTVQTLKGSGVFNPPSDGKYTLEIRDQFQSRGGSGFVYRVRLAPAEPDFAIQLINDAESLTRGKTLNLRLIVEGRDGFSGPIEFSAIGLPKGVTLKPLKANVGTVQLSLTADKDTPIDISRVRFVGTAKGLTRQSDELLLGVGLLVPFKYIAEYDLRLAPRGSVLRKSYRIERGGYEGPFEVRLADKQGRHLQGVTGPEITVPAGATKFDYPITLPPWMEIGRTSRSVVMLVGKIKDGEREHTVGYTSQEQSVQMIAVVETGRLGLELGASSISAKKGEEALLSFRVRRSKEITGPVRVSAAGKVVTIPADASQGTLRIPLTASGPIRVQATLSVSSGEMTAEATVEAVVE